MITTPHETNKTQSLISWMFHSSGDSTEVANCDTGCHIKVWMKEHRGRWQ